MESWGLGKSTDLIQPFWAIKRQAAETDQWNVELVEHEVTTVVACDFKGQVGKTAPIRYNYVPSDRAMHRQLESHCCRGGGDSEVCSHGQS